MYSLHFVWFCNSNQRGLSKGHLFLNYCRTWAWNSELDCPINAWYSIKAEEEWEIARLRTALRGILFNALLLCEQNDFHFIPNYIIIIIIPRKCISKVEHLITSSGPTYPLFSFARLFDSLRRDWIEGQLNDRGKSPHIQSSDGQGRPRPQRHLPATSFWQAGSKLQFISAHDRNRCRVSEERENFLSSGLKDLFHIQILMVVKSRTRAIRWKPSPVSAGGSRVSF